jgi:hypothetical protein
MIQASMTLSTFAANYSVRSRLSTCLSDNQGQPFMENLEKNTMMFRLIAGGMCGLILCALNMLPELTEFMELQELPESIRSPFVLLLIGDFVFAYLYEKMIDRLFSSREVAQLKKSFPVTLKKKQE